MYKLGQHIKQWRQKKNISLREMEETTGISRTTLNEIERGKREPSLKDLTIIANTTEIPTWKALELAGYPSDFHTDETAVALASLARYDPEIQALIELLQHAEEKDRNAVLSYLRVRAQG